MKYFMRFLKDKIKTKIVFLTGMILFISGNIFASVLPADTSFTIYSAADKIKNKFPNAQLVKTDILADIKFIRDINYSTIENHKLFLDLFSPSKKIKGGSPAVVIIHGGGWHSGDKTMEHPIAAYLAQKGFVCATVEYRMAMDFPYPAGVYDIKTSIRWLHANSKKYNIDVNKIAVLGCSAGAEMATFIGTTNKLNRFEGDGGYKNFSSSVQAIVNIDGIVDFLHINSTKYDENPEKPCAANNWLGGSYKIITTKWKEASPITYAGKNTPPVLFINSALEDYHAGRDEFIKILSNNKIYCEIHTIPETPHPFWLFHPWFNKTCELTENFLNKIFIKGKK